MHLGGLTPGTEFDQVVQTSGVVTLAGALNVSFLDGFENLIVSSDSFDILTSDRSLSGTFSNVASGSRLTTSDGIGSFLVTYAGQNKVTLSFQAFPKLTAALSRKTHSATGIFDINLPLTGNPGMECRSSGGNHTLVFTFNNDVISGSASVTGGAELCRATPPLPARP